MKKVLFLFAIAGLVFTSCKKDEVLEPEEQAVTTPIVVTPTETNYDLTADISKFKGSIYIAFSDSVKLHLDSIVITYKNGVDTTLLRNDVFDDIGLSTHNDAFLLKVGTDADDGICIVYSSVVLDPNLVAAGLNGYTGNQFHSEHISAGSLYKGMNPSHPSYTLEFSGSMGLSW